MPRHSLSRNDLGCGIVWTTTGCLQEVAISHQVGEAKVSNLDVVVGVKEETGCQNCRGTADSLLGFEVAVYDVVTMAVLDSADHLLEEPAGLVLVHLPLSASERQYCHACTYPSLALGNNVVEQLLASVLHNHDDVGGSCDDLVAVFGQLLTLSISVTYSLIMCGWRSTLRY